MLWKCENYCGIRKVWLSIQGFSSGCCWFKSGNNWEIMKRAVDTVWKNLFFWNFNNTWMGKKLMRISCLWSLHILLFTFTKTGFACMQWKGKSVSRVCSVKIKSMTTNNKLYCSINCCHYSYHWLIDCRKDNILFSHYMLTRHVCADIFLSSSSWTHTIFSLDNYHALANE
jgi:hypothetical protein